MKDLTKPAAFRLIPLAAALSLANTALAQTSVNAAPAEPTPRMEETII